LWNAPFFATIPRRRGWILRSKRRGRKVTHKILRQQKTAAENSSPKQREHLTLTKQVRPVISDYPASPQPFVDQTFSLRNSVLTSVKRVSVGVYTELVEVWFIASKNDPRKKNSSLVKQAPKASKTPQCPLLTNTIYVYSL
jgi:hypothetical protein